MQQHPIPQNITTYQFRLVGDMTLKQFLELISGVIVAIIVYNTNLLAPIKFSLIGICVLVGFALAFMPIEERPLDQWLLAFIKSIYNPTHFIWKKHPRLPTFFTYTPHVQTGPADAQEVMEAILQRKRAGLSSFLQTLPADHLLTTIEKQENQQLENIFQLFESSDLKSLPLPNSVKPATALNISYQAPAAAAIPTSTESITAPTAKHTFTNPQPVTSVSLIKDNSKDLPTPPPPIGPQNSPQAPQPLASAIPKKPPLSTATSEAQTSTDLPFPSTPASPNTIVGMVLTPDNKIIENAIIEIRDADQIPVRATKTNKLGQFFSTTPLKNGIYEIEVEKDNHSFDILKLKLDGQIINPLKIQAKSIN